MVTGGFPRTVGLWDRGSLEAFLRGELADPSSEFVGAAERILDGELPSAVAGRTVLSVIGEAQRTGLREPLPHATDRVADRHRRLQHSPAGGDADVSGECW
jgi:hypothetical protein